MELVLQIDVIASVLSGACVPQYVHRRIGLQQTNFDKNFSAEYRNKRNFSILQYNKKII
jgi:hypothetical protein